MTKKTNILIMTMLAITLMLSMTFLPLAPTSAALGPRHTGGLDILFYANPDAAWLALKDGTIDFMQWSLTTEQFDEAQLNPKLQVAGYDENGMFEFDINNNHTVEGIAPGIVSPTHELTMRQAITHVTDKDYIIWEILKGFGGRIDAPICAPQAGYANDTVTGVNFPYPFDMELAQVALFGELVPVCTPETYVASTWINLEEDQNVDLISGVVTIAGDGLLSPGPNAGTKGMILHVEEEAVLHFEGKARYTFRWCDWPKWLWEFVPISETLPYDPSTYFWLERAAKVHVISGVVVVVNTGAVLTPSTVYTLPKGATLHVVEAAVVHVVSGQVRYGHGSILPPPAYPWPYRWKFRHHYLNGLFPMRADGWRFFDINGNGIEDAGETLDVELSIRNDHAHRLEAGRYLSEQLNAVGVATTKVEASSDVLFPKVMDDMNYHVYTGGWSFGRYPTYLFGLFHESMWWVGGGASNYVTALNSSGLPNYPEADDAIAESYYAKNMSHFTSACWKATGIIMEHCMNVPLWSYRAWWAYRKNVVGIVNMKGSGLENDYTFLHASKIDDPDTPGDESQDPIRMGTINFPKDLNVLFSQWYYDYAVLDRIFNAGISTQPYRLEVDQPWIYKDWEEDLWFNDQIVDDPLTPDDERWCTKVTYYIREDVYWVAPVTGEKLQQFTSHDVEFTQWYIYSYPTSWPYQGFMDVHHTKIIDDFTIEFYFNMQSMFLKYFPTGPLLKKGNATDGWLEKFCEKRMIEFHIDYPIEPCMKFPLLNDDEQIVQVINATKDGVIPLEECIDFQIVAPDPELNPDAIHNWFHWKGEGAIPYLEPSQTIQIWYWTPVVNPDGQFPGAPTYSWEDTMYSIGSHYPIDIQMGAGGWATLEANPHFFLETPEKGEIDWLWTWDSHPTPGPLNPGPDGGYYQVFLYDGVKVSAAYGSRGDGIPSINWFPGADIDTATPCWIYLYDGVTVSGKYGTKFGIPP